MSLSITTMFLGGTRDMARHRSQASGTSGYRLIVFLGETLHSVSTIVIRKPSVYPLSITNLQWTPLHNKNARRLLD